MALEPLVPEADLVVAFALQLSRGISSNFPSFQTKHFCESETSYSFGWENHRLIIDEFQEGGDSLANDISDLHQEP